MAVLTYSPGYRFDTCRGIYGNVSRRKNGKELNTKVSQPATSGHQRNIQGIRHGPFKPRSHFTVNSWNEAGCYTLGKVMLSLNRFKIITGCVLDCAFFG